MDWISVKDRLPEDDNEVLVYYGGSRVKWKYGIEFVNYINGECYGWCGQDQLVSVTHWMPLPAPPDDSATYPQTIGNAHKEVE